MLKTKWPILQIDRVHKRLGGHTRAWAQHKRTHSHTHTHTLHYLTIETEVET